MYNFTKIYMSRLTNIGYLKNSIDDILMFHIK